MKTSTTGFLPKLRTHFNLLLFLAIMLILSVLFWLQLIFLESSNGTLFNDSKLVDIVYTVLFFPLVIAPIISILAIGIVKLLNAPGGIGCIVFFGFGIIVPLIALVLVFFGQIIAQIFYIHEDTGTENTRPKLMTCSLGFHQWDGCKCKKCDKERNKGHKWDGCKCVDCGKIRDESHNWFGCKCRECGKTRDESHNWFGCKCRECGKTRDENHNWYKCKCQTCGKTRDEEHDWVKHPLSERQYTARCRQCGKEIFYDGGVVWVGKKGA
jgi:hypothetical protein